MLQLKIQARSAQFPEEGAHLIGEQLRLFKRREMSAPLHHAPAANIGEHARCDVARGFQDFARELRVAGGHRDGFAGGQDRRAVEAA